MARPFRSGLHLNRQEPACGRFRLVALSIALGGLLLAYLMPDGLSDHPAYARTADSTIEYAENGTAPVASFTASDQDGDAISWDVSGPDSERFNINDRGVLSFRAPPDYEKPQSTASGGPLAERNVYRVTIAVGGGTHQLDVRVTDVDEAGGVSMDRPQPQVGRPLGASLSDQDDGVTDERWQWARSGDGTTVDRHLGGDLGDAEPWTGRGRYVPAGDGHVLRQVRLGQDGLGGEHQPCGGQDALQRRSLLRRAGLG